MESQIQFNKRRAARTVTSVVVSASAAILSGAIVLQAYFSIFAPSTSGRFSEFPAILVYSTFIVAMIYGAIIIPCFATIRRRHQTISLRSSALIGAAGGFFLMLIIISITGWPRPTLSNKLAYLASGTISGAIAIVTYAILSRPTR